MPFLQRTLPVCFALFWLVTGSSEAVELAPGKRIEANGEPISVDVGHAVPLAVDWDGDGRKDLLVGQFAGGKIRFYRNTGTDEAPRFEDFSYLEAGEKEISVPAG